MGRLEKRKDGLKSGGACGRPTNAGNMCFLARPSQPEYALEEGLLKDLSAAEGYELYSAIQHYAPGYDVFCEKNCSQILASRSCIVLLNHPAHPIHSNVRIPNPNVFLEYGMMLGFGKRIVPMQRATETLPFDVHALDTVKYATDNLEEKAKLAIRSVTSTLYPVLKTEVP